MARYSILSTWPREALEFANALERAARALRTARRGLSGAYGLTVAEWQMLRALRSPRKSTAASAGAGMRQERSVAELARRLRISRQAAHRTAARLERAGLLRCVPRGGDRRLRLASLTPDGEHSLEQPGIDDAHAAARDDQRHFPPLARAPDRCFEPVVGPAAVLPVRLSCVAPGAEGGRPSTQTRQPG